MDLKLILSVTLTVLLGIGLHLFNNAIPKLCEMSIKRSAARLPFNIKFDMEKAWVADFALLTTDVERIRCAYGCWIGTFTILNPFARLYSRHRLRRARSRLQTFGTIFFWCVEHMKMQQGRISRWQLFKMRLMLAAQGKVEPAMKEYMLRLADDVKLRTSPYASQEEAANDLFKPVQKEMKLYLFLREKDKAMNNKKSGGE